MDATTDEVCSEGDADVWRVKNEGRLRFSRDRGGPQQYKSQSSPMSLMLGGFVILNMNCW
jgi:hypothetical protein